ncbi:MAG: hypothetical protein R3F17_11655 [Planctomycetota bacterium]
MEITPPETEVSWAADFRCCCTKRWTCGKPVTVICNVEIVFAGEVQRRFEVLIDTPCTGDPGLQYSIRVPAAVC